jgi:integrase
VASIQRRKPRTPGGSVSYRVRYRDPSGTEQSKSFTKHAQALAFKATVEADKLRGTYVDPKRGRMTLGEYAELWLAQQTFGLSTREQTTSRVRGHIIPSLGSTPLVALRASQVQSWVKAKQEALAPRTVHLIFGHLSSMLSAAVDDERIPKNPCKAGSIRLPKVDPRKVVPWTAAQVVGIRRGLPDRYRALLVLATGLGLRQGETFGLAVDDIDFLRQEVHVLRQVTWVEGCQVFALPKHGRTRKIPLSSRVAEALSAYIQQFPPTPVTLPWDQRGGRPVTANLLVISREGKALNRNYINRNIWKPALRLAGIDPTRDQMMHAGRHLFASAQLEAGTSIRALAEYLGHNDPGFTLRTYTHLMPEAEDKAKRAVDTLFERLDEVVDDPLCGPDVAREAL